LKEYGRYRELVTGGASFIGSRLCERLLSEGHEVQCDHKFSTGSSGSIPDLMGNPCFEVLPHDITFRRSSR